MPSTEIISSDHPKQDVNLKALKGDGRGGDVQGSQGLGEKGAGCFSWFVSLGNMEDEPRVFNFLLLPWPDHEEFSMIALKRAVGQSVTPLVADPTSRSVHSLVWLLIEEDCDGLWRKVWKTDHSRSWSPSLEHHTWEVSFLVLTSHPPLISRLESEPSKQGGLV